MNLIEQNYTKDRMSNNKMKGLFKGLRYISQIFENEKEPEMEIGNPTDVKHVAHIGMDGPSVSTPSWMNEFKSPHLTGDSNDDSNAKGISEDSSRKGSRVKDSPRLPKSSKKSASGSPTKEKSSNKTKRRSSANNTASEGSSRPSRRSKEISRQEGDSSSRRNCQPEIPKKSRGKKSKDSVEGGSYRSSRRAPASDTDQMSDCMSETGSVMSMS